MKITYIKKNGTEAIEESEVKELEVEIDLKSYIVDYSTERLDNGNSVYRLVER